jgi:hypothetical protein
MALLFFDTAQFGSAPEAGWDAGSANNRQTSGGPFNDGYTFTNAMARTLGVNAATVTIGYWWKPQNGVAITHWDLVETATVQCRIAHTASNQLTLRNGTAGTIHITSGTNLNGVWHYVEWKIPLGNSVNVELRIDGGASVGGLTYTASSVDTTTTANNYITSIRDAQGGNSNTQNWSMFHIADATGTGITDFIGPTKGYFLGPSADGNYTQWAASAGTRWQAVDDWLAFAGSDSDSTYISDNTVGHKNSVALANTVAGLGTIYGLVHSYNHRRDDAGPHTVRGFLRSSGTDQNGTTQTCGTSYAGWAEFYEFSPFTGGSTRWTTAEVDGLESGVEVIT